jgi:methyltransferase (TIGR00027 family)
MHIPLLDRELTLPRPRELPGVDRPSAVAQWLVLGRALELERDPLQRIVSDEFAPAFLSARGRAALAALRSTGPLLHLSQRRRLAGLSTYALCRHRQLDLALHTALLDGVEQVLILGAGYDSRAYRFEAELRGRPVHEVDLAPLSRRKAAIVAAHPARFGGARIRRVETDFRDQSLARDLLASGFAVGARTFVAWEGVVPYLSRDTVGATLDTLRELCGAGSTLTVDFWDGSGGPGPLAPVRQLAARAGRLIGEPVAFGLRPDAVADYLGLSGFHLVELHTARELANRFATDGRPVHESLYLVTARI